MIIDYQLVMTRSKWESKWKGRSRPIGMHLTFNGLHHNPGFPSNGKTI